MASGGFNKSASGVVFFAGIALTYLAMPYVYEPSYHWLIDFTLRTYGPAPLGWLGLGWKIVLALLLFNTISAVLSLFVTRLSTRLAERFYRSDLEE
ncbi:MAG: hypothetical protein KDA50_05305 [Rhodobacteraceae bacterium]|nr:hypothetical protein [Paracoccaceae bacterium]